jgi:BASS family bile acid:Na+ symporter
MELLHTGAKVAVLLFVVSSMLAMGLSLTVSQVIAPLRNGRLVLLTLLANFVLLPLAALALTRLLQLEPPHGIGLLLLAIAAGAPFLPKLTEIAKGNMAFAVGMMVLLMVITVGYLPLVLPLLLEGVSVDPAKIARSLILVMLLPLATGFVVKAHYERTAARMQPVFNRISSVSFILLAVLLLVANIGNVIEVFGTGGILAGAILIATGFGIGWLLGGPSNDMKRVMALGTAQRNVSAAILVSNQNFDDPKVAVMVIVTAMVGLLMLIPLSRVLARQSEGG